MEHYLEQLNLTEMMEELDSFFPDASLDLWGMFERILSGEWKEAGQMAWQGLFGSIWEQVAGMKGLFVSLLILGILSVLVSCFLASFENHQIAQIAHYIFYLLLLAIVLKVFARCYGTAAGAMESMAGFSKFVLPALCLSLGPAAGGLTAAGYYELALVLIFLVETFLLQLCLPFLPVFMLLLLMNGVWEEGKLASLMELVEKGLKAASGFCLAAVAGLGVLQSMVAPALDGLKRGAVQKAVSAIPALGGLAESTTQLLIGSAVLLKNSLGLFALILLVLLIAAPFGELLFYGVMLRAAGAFLGIVADKRLTACVNRTADAVFLTLRLSGTAAACFLVLIAIVTCLAGGQL